jgi:hypothetical protein
MGKSLSESEKLLIKRYRSLNRFERLIIDSCLRMSNAQLLTILGKRSERLHGFDHILSTSSRDELVLHR